MTPEQVEQLFAELRQTAQGTRVKFHMQESEVTIEGIIIEPPGERPAGLDDGVFLRDVEDFTQIYCLCADRGNNGVGNILVHTFVQSAAPPARDPSPAYEDEISRRLQAAARVVVGGGARQELCGAISGVVDTNAPAPAPMTVTTPPPE